jgi:hypothetical protein
VCGVCCVVCGVWCGLVVVEVLVRVVVGVVDAVVESLEAGGYGVNKGWGDSGVSGSWSDSAHFTALDAFTRKQVTDTQSRRDQSIV